MSLILNRAKVQTATTGTGTVTLGSAVVPFQTWASAQAGASTTRRYSYLIEDGNAWELGEGIFDEGANTLTRVLVASSTGSLLSLSGSATVSCVAKATDAPQLIDKFNGNGSTTSYTFSDIPQDFSQLRLVIYGRLTSTAAQVTMLWNGLTTAIYDFQRQYALNATNTANQGLAQTAFNQFCTLPGSAQPAGQVGFSEVDIYGYASSLFTTGYHRNRWPASTTTYDGYDLHGSLQQRNAAALTSIRLTFPSAPVVGSYVTLTGVP